jgi:hypothetical protein
MAMQNYLEVRNNRIVTQKVIKSIERGKLKQKVIVN